MKSEQVVLPNLCFEEEEEEEEEKTSTRLIASEAQDFPGERILEVK
jgi:hypothetical protein